MGEEELSNQGTSPASGRVLLEEQIKALQDALTKRMNPIFDPTLMALSAGFLKPTQTGGFGESLGYALEGVSGAQEKERSRKAELEKLKLDLALKQYDLARKDKASKLFQDAMRGQQPMMSQDVGQEAPQGMGLTSDVGEKPDTVSQEKPKTVDVTPSQAVKVARLDQKSIYGMTMTPEIVAAIAKEDPELGKIAYQAYTMQKGMVELRQKEREIAIQEETSGYRGKEVAQKEFDTVERRHPFDPSDTIKISRKDIPAYDNVLATGNPIEVSKFLAKIGTPGYFGKTFDGEPAEGFKPPPIQSEREIEKLRKEERIKADIEEDKKQKTLLFDRAENARNSLLPTANALYKFSTSKDTKNAFDYMNKQGFMPAFTSLVENGLSVGSFKIGLPDVKQAMMKFGINGATQQDIETLQLAAQYTTRLQLDIAKADAKGAISNYENQLFQKAAYTPNDTARVVALKSELLITKAKMDTFVAQKYSQWLEKNPDGYVYQFMQTPEIQKLKNQYDRKLDEVQSKYGFGLSLKDMKE